MGLTIHWDLQGPKTKTEAEAAIEKMRQRAMDLAFDAVGEIVHFKGEEARFVREREDDQYSWLKIMARVMLWNPEKTLAWECSAREIIGFEIDVAPGCEPMEVFLATYHRAIQVEDERTGKPKLVRTNRSGWSGGGFCKTQYASHPDCGGVANFLRAHLSVCRMLDHAKELGILQQVKDEGDFFNKRNIPALVSTIGNWNAFVAGIVGGLSDLVGGQSVAPIKDFPNFEHLEAKGQEQIDALLRLLKERGKRN